MRVSTVVAKLSMKFPSGSNVAMGAGNLVSKFPSKSKVSQKFHQPW